MFSAKQSFVDVPSTTPSETKHASQAKVSKSAIGQIPKIADQEEKELVVYSVREELMKRVMDEIYKRYLEKQCIKFTVDCAHKALIQVLKNEFLVHDKVTC